MKTSLQKVIADLIKKHYGSMRSMSRWTGVDVAYISRLKSGEKDNPSDEMLDKLGIEKITTYKRLY